MIDKKLPLSTICISVVRNPALGKSDFAWITARIAGRGHGSWVRANVADELGASTLTSAIDRVLHAERCVLGGRKVTFDAPLVELPRVAMFEHEDAAYLVAAAGYLTWSFDGYGAAKGIGGAPVVKVLTPSSVVRAFEAGFTPIVHQSACE